MRSHSCHRMIRTGPVYHPRRIGRDLLRLVWIYLLVSGLPTAAQVPADTVLSPDQASVAPATDLSLSATVDRYMTHMTVADKVGQLFVVNFQGAALEPDSPIVRLIHDYRIGGVVLDERHGNIDNQARIGTPQQVARLINQLQTLVYGVYLPPLLATTGSQGPVMPTASMTSLPPPLLDTRVSVPLLVGVPQVGAEQFGAVLRNGFTPIPNQLAIGATWQPDLARAVGTILGQELRAVGVNVLLGPSLDVFSRPRRLQTGTRATATFGEDSWWVGQHGRAFIEGVQEGSGQAVLTFARHFPGQGGSDRTLDQELATIQVTLEELRRHALNPFAQVTVTDIGDQDRQGVTDGLLTSHIRYSGFLRSRERTPPISLSPHLDAMLMLTEFQPWRNAGGLTMSDGLGVRAIRAYYDPSEQTFLANRIASDALQAGNDLLWLAQFAAAEEQELGALEETILFFILQYSEKPDFAAAVDEAVRRILMAKLRLYASTVLSTAPGSDPMDTYLSNHFVPGVPAAADTPQTYIGIHPRDVWITEQDMTPFSPVNLRLKTDIITRIAQHALTLLNASGEQSNAARPPEPSINDRIVIFTDARFHPSCATCPRVPVLESTLIESLILRLFGPEATQQVRPHQITSFSFRALSTVLDRTASLGLQTRMERSLVDANWILFAMLDTDHERYPDSDAVSRFLRQRNRLAVEKDIAVLSFDVPYMLDETDINKISVYIAAYSPTLPFVESAVRALFRDLELPGAPPVSVPGTPFHNLVARLEPDPDQIINLTLFDAKRSSLDPADLEVHLGDSLQIRAGPIMDRNGHRVPDGTPVQFLLRYVGDDMNLLTDPIPTRNGSAHIEVTLERSGQLELAAQSLHSRTSVELQIWIEDETPAQIKAVQPTTTPTSAPSLASTVPTAEVPASQAPPRPALRLGSLLGTWGTMGILLLIYALWVSGRLPRSLLLQRLLWGMIMGTGTYVIYGMAWSPLTRWLGTSLFPVLVVPVASIAALAPLLWLHMRD